MKLYYCNHWFLFIDVIYNFVVCTATGARSVIYLMNITGRGIRFICVSQLPEVSEDETSAAASVLDLISIFVDTTTLLQVRNVIERKSIWDTNSSG